MNALSPHALAAAKHMAIIDVRPIAERHGELGFLPGSRSFSDHQLDELTDELLQVYGEDSAIAVVCLSGKRSLPVAKHLLGAGMRAVAHLEGGLLAWQAAGLPLCGVRPVSDEELVPLDSAEQFPRVVMSCFVAESVETQLDSGAQQITDPRSLVEEVFGRATEPDQLLSCLDRLAEHARRAGHPLAHIATNVDRLRASLLSVLS